MIFFKEYTLGKVHGVLQHLLFDIQVTYQLRDVLIYTSMWYVVNGNTLIRCVSVYFHPVHICSSYIDCTFPKYTHLVLQLYNNKTGVTYTYM